MFLNTPYDDRTWDLLVSALAGELSPLEETQFRQWLDSSTDNREFYEQLLRVWNDMELEDFSIFEQTDDATAWEGFLTALNARRSQDQTTPAATTPVIPIPDGRATKLPGKTWMSAAAAILLIAGAGWWIFAPKSHTYETALNERRTVSLP